MQLIAVDIGNSSTKIAVQDLDEGRTVRWYAQHTFRFDDAIELELSATPAFWSVCSVNQKRMQRLENWVATNRSDDKFHVIAENEVAIKSTVDSRTQTGRDRLVAAWMACELADHDSVVVVDAGTAVTIDVVKGTVFQGGVIFAGAETCLRQMSQAAPALPDLSLRDSLGDLESILQNIAQPSTVPAILSGVYQNQIAAITNIAGKMAKDTDATCQIYATGGGIADIQNHLPQDWNFVPDLVLRGAKAIGGALLREISGDSKARE